MQVTYIIPHLTDYISSKPMAIFNTRKRSLTWKFSTKHKKIKILLRANKGGRAVGKVILRSEHGEERRKIRTTIQRCGLAMHMNSYDTEDPVKIGKMTIYVIEVRNEGTNPATKISLCNIVSDKMKFISAKGVTPYRIYQNEVVFDKFPILQPGEKIVYRIACKAIKKGNAKNTARLKYLQFDRAIIDEEGTIIYE